MYNVNIIYYLPILWAISCFILALNFVRNRTLFKQNITCITLNEEIHIPKTENTQQILTKNEFIDIESENKSNSQHNISIPSKKKILQIYKNSRSLCDLYTKKQVPIPSTINRTLSAPGDHTKLDLNTTSVESYDSYDSLPKLHENKDSKSLDIYNDPKPPQLLFLQPAHSDPIASSNSNKLHENTRNNMTTTAKVSTLRALSGLSILSPKSIYHNMDTIEDHDNNSTPEPMPATPVPLHLIVTPLVENDDIVIHDTIKVTTLATSNEDINGEEDENAGFEILFDDDDDEKNNEMINMDIQMNDLRLINHGRSNSVPMNMNMDELFESFNVLAKCGFYSLKNVSELNKYQKRFSIINKSATIQ